MNEDLWIGCHLHVFTPRAAQLAEEKHETKHELEEKTVFFIFVNGLGNSNRVLTLLRRDMSKRRSLRCQHLSATAATACCCLACGCLHHDFHEDFRKVASFVFNLVTRMPDPLSRKALSAYSKHRLTDVDTRPTDNDTS